jgi:glycosyltransferase involved in cell wall biosynthesis
MWQTLQQARSSARGILARVSMPKYPGMPLLSIVMASYNTKEYVAEALRSLLNQQWREVEVIVVDDGSTDGTWEVVESFAGTHPKVRAVRQTNSGPGSARNRGAALARGKYVAFFDSDDVADPLMMNCSARAAYAYRSHDEWCSTVRGQVSIHQSAEELARRRDQLD